uniref:TNF receptor-associated factor n=1 Tax=Balaenoptera musculus TaxID=9771 RepID=A0A8C0HX91_BALMU
MEPSKKLDAAGTLPANPPLKLHPDRGTGPAVLVPEQGGYKERFVKAVEDKYKCEKCRLVLCNPKQTECGHRFCETCMGALLSSSSPKCTACREGISKDKVFKDNCCKREILALQIYCRNEGRGCVEQLALGHLLVHLKNDCQFEELLCVRADCKEKVLRKDLRDHVDKACKYREATCSHCKSQVPMITLQKHEDTECPCVVVSCPHKCSVQTLLRSEVRGVAGPVQELGILQDPALPVKLRSEKKNKSIQSLHNQICSFEIEIERQKEMLRNNESKILHLQRVIDSQAEKLKELDKEIRPFRQSWEEAGSMKSSVESLQNRVTELESVDKSAGQAARNTGLLESQLSRHDQMLSVHDIRLADMDLRFQVLETASYNGVLIWKIRDYKRRKAGGRHGEDPVPLQPAFLHRLFRLQDVCQGLPERGWHGQGDAPVAVFCHHAWRIRRSASLAVQGSSRRHLGDAFKPDPNSSSFKKPTGEMNIASGCPVFVAQTVLENGTYIKDDTIFIKVIVDTSDLPDP